MKNIIFIILFIICSAIILILCINKQKFKEKFKENITLKINYNSNVSELSELAIKYDTNNYPYTLFYENLFRDKKDEKLKIAILDGDSLMMWRDYFKNSEIYEFEDNNNLMNKKPYTNDKVKIQNNNSFETINVMFDLGICNFQDQIITIENTYKYLKPGGILIIEDISNEKEYISSINHILKDYYLLEVYNKIKSYYSKLLVIIKPGEQIFKNKNKLTIITPSYRPDNLLKVIDSINFDYIEEWIIVYDGTKITENPNIFKNNSKIKEYVYKGKGVSGNPQRNYALTKVTNPNTSLYYLDDDNTIHPDLYKLVNVIDNTKIYTFNQLIYTLNKLKILKGTNIRNGYIDTAMFIVPFNTCKNIRWIPEKRDADGYYIKECYDKYKNLHIFVDNDLCYYNKL
jgi:hypothetical protein